MIVSFSFVLFKHEKIKVYKGKSDSKEDWTKWTASVLACFILIVPCIIFPVKMETLYQMGLISSAIEGYVNVTSGDAYVFLHLSFMNYLSWFPYLLVLALIVYYGLICLVLKRHKKSLQSALIAAGMIAMILLGSDVLLDIVRPYETMSEKAYLKYKDKYETITEAFGVLPEDMTDIDSEKVNQYFEGKKRYEAYMNVSKFDDQKHRVYYDVSEQYRAAVRSIDVGVVYVISLGACLLCVQKNAG